MHASTRSALLLALLPGLAATDNAICKVLSPLIDRLDSNTPLTCSCVSDGTGLNIGGDAECDIEIGPPPVDALAGLKIKFHAGTTVRPCATPATVSVEAGITLPTPSSTELDGSIDTMVETAVAELDKDEVAYDSSTNKITVTLSAEAGTTKEVEVPIQKWSVADFLAKVGLKVEGSMGGLTTTQTVDLCMKAGDTEICGAGKKDCRTCIGSGATWRSPLCAEITQDMDDDDYRDLPSWDGNPLTWDRYKTPVDWFVSETNRKAESTWSAAYCYT